MNRIDETLLVLRQLGFPRQQLNQRSALCLLALLGLKEGEGWGVARNPLMGVTPIMDFIRNNYGRSYAPNTRETVRRMTLHQFVQAGLAIHNPDDPSRPTNSPKAAYQIDNEALQLLRVYGSEQWADALAAYLAKRPGLAQRYARAKSLALVPLRIERNRTINLSPGPHSELIRAIIEEFAPRFAPGSDLVYVGDTGGKDAYPATRRLTRLGVAIPKGGKMPDVVLYYNKRKWLLLVEAVTSHGPMDAKRHAELASLFSSCRAGIVYVTAFPGREQMKKYLTSIAWETEVWCADAPTHLIHFNGDRFLGPHK